MHDNNKRKKMRKEKKNTDTQLRGNKNKVQQEQKYIETYETR